MATLDVRSVGKKGKAGTVELDPAIFEAPVRSDLIHAEVRRQLAGRRSGTHSTKNRTAVSGGGAKPWRQKGTGRSRQGTTRAPQWAGGGVVFGPVPRGYAHKLPKKVRAAALRSALAARFADEAITIVDALEIDEYKTRRVREMLSGLGLEGRGVLIVVDESNPHLEGSAQNLPGVSVIRSEGLNVYDVLRHSALVITRAALDQVQARLGKTVAGERA